MRMSDRTTSKRVERTRSRAERRLDHGGGGQLHGEDGTPGHALAGEAASVLLHDAVGNGKPEPRALAHLLGGEERLEDAGHDLGRDAGAVVLELHDDPAPL